MSEQEATMKVAPEIAVAIAVKQNRIRDHIKLLKMQKSEAVKEWNDKLKAAQEALDNADDEWRAGAMQAEFEFADDSSAGGDAE